VERRGGKLDATCRRRVEDGCIIHMRYIMVKFSKILCRRGGTLRRRTLLRVQHFLLNMNRTGLMYMGMRCL
jgi:hypothetical protein